MGFPGIRAGRRACHDSREVVLGWPGVRLLVLASTSEHKYSDV